MSVDPEIPALVLFLIKNRISVNVLHKNVVVDILVASKRK